MIKLQDFARKCGVTDRAIQKHLQKHAKELKGHFERKGPNGTWLDDYACDYLRGFMKQQPIVISEPSAEVEALKQRIGELEQLVSEKEKLLAMSQQTTQNAQNRVAELEKQVERVKLLETDKTALEVKCDGLEALNNAMKNATLWQRLKGFK